MNEVEKSDTLVGAGQDCTKHQQKKQTDEREKEEYEKKKAEYEKKKAEYEKKKAEETISLILRQTDYDREMAEKKMKEWENNYINIIKEFMDPNFKENYLKKMKAPIKSVNQNVMGEIRNFMDDVNKQYTYRKRVSEYNQNRQTRFILACKQKLAKQIEKVKEIWPDAPDDCWKEVELQKLLLGYRGGSNFWEILYNKTFCDFHFMKK